MPDLPPTLFKVLARLSCVCDGLCSWGFRVKSSKICHEVSVTYLAKLQVSVWLVFFCEARQFTVWYAKACRFCGVTETLLVLRLTGSQRIDCNFALRVSRRFAAVSCNFAQFGDNYTCDVTQPEVIDSWVGSHDNNTYVHTPCCRWGSSAWPGRRRRRGWSCGRGCCWRSCLLSGLKPWNVRDTFSIDDVSYY